MLSPSPTTEGERSSYGVEERERVIEPAMSSLGNWWSIENKQQSRLQLHFEPMNSMQSSWFYIRQILIDVEMMYTPRMTPVRFCRESCY